MQTFNYPTTIYYGQDAIEGLRNYLDRDGYKRLLLITDKGLVNCGIVSTVEKRLQFEGFCLRVFDGVHPNPVEEDVLAAARCYKEQSFDGIIAVGGGSAIDVAKGVKILATHPEPLALYDDTKDGFRRITSPMPELFAISTIAGSGSEVGRSSVIIIEGRKTVLFHPALIPRIAVLSPELTITLPQDITAAGAMDAFVHCLEAYLVPAFDPMADGIAKEGMALLLKQLPLVMANAADIEARGKLLMGATMGATAFQKGLGMIHSMAHPLSCHYGMHHGLANALLLPIGMGFLEARCEDNPALSKKIDTVGRILREAGAQLADDESLSSGLARLNESVGIVGGLAAHGVKVDDIKRLASDAIADPCHTTNAIPVTMDDFIEFYQKAL